MKTFKLNLIFLISFASLFCITPVISNVLLSQENILSENTNSKEHPSSEIRADGKVSQLDRFYRVYEDGTIEFKFVLDNGVAQYQKITNKEVNGKTIQVYEGYHSEPLPDKTYRTTYYIADENGYRRTRREFDTKPPVLPPYVPYVPKLKLGN
ncbi:uncharacterized protein LOC129948602 [Eupeodes corollae]|uniref:uncharacterized protein LOC129948602 n=1 Tax=Eupeodes corollae TaxID=290404 RepID=UPI00248F528F|nr:uncharacterized protein LOC129948602 [Eupeodes corollae]